MAVPESFKDALDIKLTPRRCGGTTEMLWTQGRGYDFHVGDTLHDRPESYGNWGEALAVINLSVQLLFVSSSGYVTSETIETTSKELEVTIQSGKSSPKVEIVDGITVRKLRLDQGIVRFRVHRPNVARTRLEEAELIECTQDDFVAFLQTGIVRTDKNQLLNLFASDA